MYPCHTPVRCQLAVDAVWFLLYHYMSRGPGPVPRPACKVPLGHAIVCYRQQNCCFETALSGRFSCDLHLRSICLRLYSQALKGVLKQCRSILPALSNTCSKPCSACALLPCSYAKACFCIASCNARQRHITHSVRLLLPGPKQSQLPDHIQLLHANCTGPYWSS